MTKQANTMTNYTFTDQQLAKLLYETIDMFLERMRALGKEHNARHLTVNDVFVGLNAEQELVDDGIVGQAVGQVYFAPPTPKAPENVPNWIEKLL